MHTQYSMYVYKHKYVVRIYLERERASKDIYRIYIFGPRERLLLGKTLK